MPERAKELPDGIMQLKGNKIPRGLVSLEYMFDRNDAYKNNKDDKSREAQDSGGYEKVNIGTDNEPKYINLGKCCPRTKKKKFISLLVEFKDVFSWSYDDLNNFREGRFQHQIPLKLRASPFRQKIRNFNPKMAQAIFQEVDKMLKARIIYPIHHSTWIANIVPVRKKKWGNKDLCGFQKS